MEFTYLAYDGLLNMLTAYGYEFSNYHNWQSKTTPVILRHDIDNDLSHALNLAKFEAGGCKEYLFCTFDF